MKLLKVSVVAMFIIAFALAFSSVAAIEKFYKRPLFLALAVIFVVIQAACIVIYRAKWNFRKVGYYLSHIGVLLIAVGAFISMFYAQKVNFNIPVGGNTAYREVQMDDGSILDFGFSIALTSFRLDTVKETGEVKQYEANLKIFDGEEAYERLLNVNNPTVYNGWKFYIMGYDTSTMSTVGIFAKKDPGNLWLLIGFIVVDLGVAIMCFSALNKKKRGKVQ